MGITQQIGASSLIKPGVIDNTAARPASPFEGQVIFQKDTDQLLVWNGTAWVIPNSPAQNPTGLELVTPTGSTNGTVGATGLVTVGNAVSSVTVSGAFSSLYTNYKIMYSNGAASAACDLAIQLSGITTAYFGGIMHVSSAPGGVAVAGVNNAASWTFAGTMRGSTAGGFMDLDLYGPFSTATRTRVHAPYVRSDDQSFGTFTGIVENTASASGFVLSPNGGATITGGQIAVYGYRI